MPTYVSVCSGLSASSQRALDEVQQPHGPAAAMNDDDEWEDLQDLSVPMDTEITLTAEGDEVEILREMSGVCVHIKYMTSSYRSNIQ